MIRLFIGRAAVVRIYTGRKEIWTAVPSWGWTAEAACRGAGADVFVPADTTTTPPLVEALCPVCPVRATCETVGRATRSLGWWGGVLLDEFGQPQQEARSAGDLHHEVVAEIRRRHQLGASRRTLATDFNVGEHTIRTILNEGRARQPTKTHCAHGHPYDEANISFGADGVLRCRTCERIRMRARALT